MKESEREWFRPLWLRLLVTGFVAAWFAWEVFFTQDQFWMLITAAALAYAVWNLIIRYKEPAPRPAAAAEENGDGKPEA